jgi:uncharacterized membrane protein
MGTLAWIGTAVLLILSFVFLNIFGLVVVVIGIVFGFRDEGFHKAVGISAILFAVFFAVAFLLLGTVLAASQQFFLLGFLSIGAAVVFLIGEAVAIGITWLGYKAGEAIS